MEFLLSPAEPIILTPLERIESITSPILLFRESYNVIIPIKVKSLKPQLAPK